MVVTILVQISNFRRATGSKQVIDDMGVDQSNRSRLPAVPAIPGPLRRRLGSTLPYALPSVLGKGGTLPVLVPELVPILPSKTPLDLEDVCCCCCLFVEE
jgi:hypothetical protein